MKLDKACALFFGTKIDSKLREALSQCKPGDRKYFEGGSDEFLRIVEVEEEKWIGKVVKGGTPITEVEDIQRNIISILRRVAPNARVPASSVKIFVLQGASAQPAVVDDEEADEAEPASSGPYIANY
jgi:hypothetical protein